MRGSCCNMVKKTENSVNIPCCRQPSAAGKITQRSCVYYGARWMLAPIVDAIHLVHAPVGCAYYGSTVRGKNYRIFSTGIEEKDIIFGGTKRLLYALRELKLLMPQAKCIFVYVTCSTAIIGDDVIGVCKKLVKEIACPIVVVNCPGFKGESQAVGHEVAYEAIINLIGKNHKKNVGNYDVNIIGDYNVNGETEVLKSLLAKIGINVHAVFTGDVSYEKITTAHQVKLNLLICHTTGRVLANAMQRKFGIPYLKVSFFGLSRCKDSLKKIGEFFGLEKKVKKLINEELEIIKPKLTQFLPKLKSKKAGLFFGGARMSLIAEAIKDLGMEIVFTGSQFGDKMTYNETWNIVNSGTYIIDDASEHDLEYMLNKLRPDVFMGGIKEQYLSHKFGIGYCLFPQPKHAGAYVGFRGFINFARDIYKAIYAPVWKLTRDCE